MKMSTKVQVIGLVAAVGLGTSAFAKGRASDAPVVEQKSAAQMAAEVRATQEYWTPARMAAARPMPTPTVVVSAVELETVQEPQALLVQPGFAPGCRPNQLNCDTSARTLNLLEEDQATPMHGTKPTANPRTGPYGPFQRWRVRTPYNQFPQRTVGKLFFTLPGEGNFVCSASVIGRSTVATAGHCNSTGSGVFATNRSFCPAYNSGQDPVLGCWAVTTSVVANPWHNGGDPDFDIACLVTATNNAKGRGKIGNNTGWLGRAWNFSSSQAERTFGYPQGSPFNGNTLQTTASTEWYTHDFTVGGPISKIIGSDLTGGSSGGPWILGWNENAGETADTDASGATDPGNNWINGVNSHKRCRVACFTPPTTTQGTFWQEMTSPPFLSGTSGNNNESEDVFGICLAHANNNA